MAHGTSGLHSLLASASTTRTTDLTLQPETELRPRERRPGEGERSALFGLGRHRPSTTGTSSTAGGKASAGPDVEHQGQRGQTSNRLGGSGLTRGTAGRRARPASAGKDAQRGVERKWSKRPRLRAVHRTATGAGFHSLPTDSRNPQTGAPSWRGDTEGRTGREGHRQVFGSLNSAAASRGRARGGQPAPRVGLPSSCGRQPLRWAAPTRHPRPARFGKLAGSQPDPAPSGAGAGGLHGTPGRAGAQPEQPLRTAHPRLGRM